MEGFKDRPRPGLAAGTEAIQKRQRLDQPSVSFPRYGAAGDSLTISEESSSKALKTQSIGDGLIKKQGANVIDASPFHLDNVSENSNQPLDLTEGDAQAALARRDRQVARNQIEKGIDGLIEPHSLGDNTASRDLHRPEGTARISVAFRGGDRQRSRERGQGDRVHGCTPAPKKEVGLGQRLVACNYRKSGELQRKYERTVEVLKERTAQLTQPDLPETKRRGLNNWISSSVNRFQNQLNQELRQLKLQWLASGLDQTILKTLAFAKEHGIDNSIVSVQLQSQLNSPDREDEGSEDDFINEIINGVDEEINAQALKYAEQFPFEGYSYEHGYNGFIRMRNNMQYLTYGGGATQVRGRPLKKKTC